MECCVFLLYLWDAVIRRKSKLVIRRLMFIVCLPCLETFDKQRVAKAGKKKKKVLEDLMGACQNNTPFSAATV